MHLIIAVAINQTDNLKEATLLNIAGDSSTPFNIIKKINIVFSDI